jgi:hypothetical protein
MEAASTSETSPKFYQITRLYNPEDSHRHIRRRENLKSHLILKWVLKEYGLRWFDLAQDSSAAGSIKGGYFLLSERK